MSDFRDEYLYAPDPFADVESSYAENGIGRTFASLVFTYKPKTVVEFGVLNGYSTLWFGKAMKELDHRGIVIGYDLWEKYEHKKGCLAEVAQRIEEAGLEHQVRLGEADIFEWAKNPEPFDILHVDISNDGDKLLRVYEMLKGRPETKGALMVFEGGTEERDNIKWMKKYNRKPIIGCGVPYEVIVTYFPGLSMVRL